jgi:hypothetical protein
VNTLRLLCLLLSTCVLVGCGGGGGGGQRSETSPTDPPDREPPPITSQVRSDRIEDYFVWLKQDYEGTAVWAKDRQVLSQWSAVGGAVQWKGNDSTEVWSMEDCGDAGRWAWVKGYANPKLGHFYPVTNVKTLWTDVDGKVHDLSTICPGVVGGPYHPATVPAAGTATLEQWATVGDEKRPYYWKTTFTYGLLTENPCWHGATPSTRYAFQQSEVWWDESGTIRGTVSSTPWIDGKPAPTETTYASWIQIAQDAGTFWNGWEKESFCLQTSTQ